MENIDPRRSHAIDESTDTHGYAARVRQMNISSSFPGVGRVVIKRAHPAGLTGPEVARQVIEEMKRRVRKHNAGPAPDKYVLLAPHAYAISDDLIAMAHTDSLNLAEAFGKSRAAVALRKKLSAEGIRLRHIREICSEVEEKSNISGYHLVVTGTRDGKLVLVPLLDLE
jgi:hypothetical protein